MSSNASAAQDPEVAGQVEGLYRELLDAWNRRDAGGFADLFADDGNVVGFDGSPVDGQPEIRSHLRRIFADHVTAAYVAKVREVRTLRPGVALHARHRRHGSTRPA